jgi:TonB-dependent SusC/RagA subfamily outer membrane receptor
MKTGILTLILIAAVLSGCKSTETNQVQDSSGMSEQRSDRITDQGFTDEMDVTASLADFLQRLPGVLVRGSGNNVQVRIRGISTFISGTEPLYVLDGQPVGNEYSQVNNMISVRQVENVRVITGSDATIYGMRGANGVIVITSKR